MMISRAPLRLAINGNPAAGQTTSDEPIARNRSQDFVSSSARRIAEFGHGLSERYRRRLDVAAAGGTIWRTAVAGIHPLPHPGQFVALLAIEAQGVGRIAVQLDDMFGCDARVLVQVVDILRDHRRHLAEAIKAGERAMATARLGMTELVAHGEAAPPRLVPRLLAGKKVVEHDRPVLGPDPARRTKIGNAALGRDPGAGEGQDRHWRPRSCPVKARHGGRDRDRARTSFLAASRYPR